MSRVRLLDCTLRDGGYCNQWEFGMANAKKMVTGLTEAKVDIVECGFVTATKSCGEDQTLFASVDDVSQLLPQDKQPDTTYVAMANYGELSSDDIPVRSDGMIDGLRIAFHKKDRVEGMKLCKEVKDKGFKVFVQAMVSVSYSDREFLELIEQANAVAPVAFYIVDSFGLMKRQDMLRFFYLVENNLDEGIAIGFHSHNNMQLAYSNAQTLVDMGSKHDIVIDSSVFGMGRGAGNLCTEIIIGYLNENAGCDYDLAPVLRLADGVVMRFFDRCPWGYSIPNYLSANYNTHPNYAGFFDEKKTLAVEDMDAVFAMMDDSKRNSFDRAYAEDIYRAYMESKGDSKKEPVGRLRQIIEGKTVLLVAPGRSSMDEAAHVEEFAAFDNVVSISVNHDYACGEMDYIFLSNLRRYGDLAPEKRAKCIVTSNIPPESSLASVDYASLLNSVDGVEDNAGLMAAKLVSDLGASEIVLAGFDGYAPDMMENYANSEMALAMSRPVIEKMNKGMTRVLSDLNKTTPVRFLTAQRFVQVEG